jgi:hypothetical protein
MENPAESVIPELICKFPNVTAVLDVKDEFAVKIELQPAFKVNVPALTVKSPSKFSVSPARVKNVAGEEVVKPPSKL